MLEIIRSGGPIMYPIIFCSVLTLAIIIERFWNLRRSKVISPEILTQVTQRLRQRNVSDAVNICRRVGSPMSNVILAGLVNFGQVRAQLREAIQDAGRHEIPGLERNLNWLSISASVAPLLGLLGTVTGMIRVFRHMALEGLGNPYALASGISEALITTAAGLIVAIPALVSHYYLSERSDRLVGEMEKNAFILVNLLDDFQHREDR